MRPAVAIAAARAAGSVDLGPAERGALTGVAERIGRQVVSIGGRATAVSWQEGYGPNLDEGALAIYALPQTTLVALGLALGLCVEPHRRLPGQVVSIADFDAAVERLLDQRSSRERSSGGGTGSFIKGALVLLHEIGLLRVDEQSLTLGPALAEWGEADWNAAHTLAARLRETVQ
ncbi:MAG: hypothetical protein ABW167_08490 [Baekduia sp.]